MKISKLCSVAVVAGLAMSAHADTVTVSASGTVLFNGIGDAPLSGVNGGETATASFTVDSNAFVDGIPGDVRAYAISNFTLSFSGGTSVGLLNPYPGTPYFGVIDGFPVSDGFFVSSSTVSPGGVALVQSDYQFNLDLGYVGTTLGSTDITDAYGTYEFDGLTRFSMNIWRLFPDNAVMEMDFASLTITPAPGTLAVLASATLVTARRRR